MDILRKRRVGSGDDQWLIAEVDARRVPGGRADRCLVCQNEQVVRRLWDYPRDWFGLSEVALRALCEGQLADRPPRTASERGRTGIVRPAPDFHNDARL
ncbi:MAG TPA: hypothetical protein VF761_04900 [Gemmatimonadaceae bacterium]